MKPVPARKLIRDIMKALLWGLCASLACSALLFLLGSAFGHMRTAAGLETARGGLCLLIAAELLLLAGALLRRGKHPSAFHAEENGWRKQFALIGPKTVLLCAALGAAACLALTDALLRAAAG